MVITYQGTVPVKFHYHLAHAYVHIYNINFYGYITEYLTKELAVQSHSQFIIY